MSVRGGGARSATIAYLSIASKYRTGYANRIVDRLFFSYLAPVLLAVNGTHLSPLMADDAGGATTLSGLLSCLRLGGASLAQLLAVASGSLHLRLDPHGRLASGSVALFLGLPEDIFAIAFSTEWFVLAPATGLALPPSIDSLFTRPA